MLTVSNDVKAKLKSDVCRKELRITIGSIVCTNSDIYNDSFELTESIMDSKVEFVGCISSILKATISTTKLPKANLQGQTVEAEVAVYLDDNTLSAYMPLFHGFVDSCETSADGHWQNLVCYDCLAYLTDTPIYNAYKKAFNGGSITLAAFRSAIFTAIGIGQEIQTLPNDAVKFRKRYRNKDLTALALIRHITQINGAFGIINRDEYFEYKYIDDSAAPEDIPYYRSLEYANTTITPINTGGLTIRTNPNDAGVTVDWTNYQQYAGTDPDWNDETQDDYLVDDDDEDISEGNYVIEGNLIAYKLKKSKKQVIAANIMDAIGHDAVFRQYKVVCNGLPYIECGDKVRFTKADSSQIGFVVFKRTLKGVQAMTDTYECMPSQEVVTNVDTSGGSGGITPQTVNADASYVSNISATTQSMGPDDALLGLIEKSVTANGTYAANDDGAEGYSEVTVNVPGGGGGGSIDTWPWEECNDLPFDFHRGTCLVYGNSIHCLAPVDANGNQTDAHWVYNDLTDSWSQESSCPSTTTMEDDLGHEQRWTTQHEQTFVIDGGDLYCFAPMGCPFPYKYTGGQWVLTSYVMDHMTWYPQNFFNGMEPRIEYQGDTYIFNGNNGQWNKIYKLNLNFYVRDEAGESPWPAWGGLVFNLDGVIHLVGGYDGPEPQIEKDYDDVTVRYNAFYDGVTPTWVLHASTTDFRSWTRHADCPLNVFLPLFTTSGLQLICSNSAPQGIVLPNANGENEIHIISTGRHVIYNKTLDAWRFADDLVENSSLIDQYGYSTLDYLTRESNLTYKTENSGIVELNGYIHIIGGYGHARKHYKCHRVDIT